MLGSRNQITSGARPTAFSLVLITIMLAIGSFGASAASTDSAVDRDLGALCAEEKYLSNSKRIEILKDAFPLTSDTGVRKSIRQAHDSVVLQPIAPDTLDQGAYRFNRYGLRPIR